METRGLSNLVLFALDVTEFCRTTKTLLDFDIGVS